MYAPKNPPALAVGSVNSENVDLTAYALQNPITIDDVVEKWEQINQFIEGLSQSTKAYLLAPWNAPF